MDALLPLVRRAAAESVAAFAPVFAGCGAIVADARYDGVLGAVGVSLVFGLIIMVMVYATGHLSGAHINPAVTVAFTLSRDFPPVTPPPTSPHSCSALRLARSSCSPSGPINPPSSAGPSRALP